MAGVAGARCPGADLALVNGVEVPSTEWDDTFPGGDADVILARRGTLPDPDTYVALLASRNHPGTVETLSAAKVGIAGCGGLGSHAALSLARMGVGAMTIADFDIVEPTNLNRQAYFAEDIGRPKTDALKKLLAGINPFIRVEAVQRELTAENSPEIFAGCGVVLECLDAAEAKGMFVEAILAGLPGVLLVAASGLGGLGDPNRIATRRISLNFWLVGDGKSAVGPERGLAAPRVMVAAGHQALCAARLLLGLDVGE